MDYPEEMKVFDLSDGYDSTYIQSFEWGIGKYNEKRLHMYTTDQFEGNRNIHMAIDIWTRAHRPVYAFADGTVVYLQDNDQPRDYGPTIVTKHHINNKSLFALYGHLSKQSLSMVDVNQPITKGDTIATIGTEAVNGGWAPHLHFQLSIQDPGEGNMPGVVTEKDRDQALTLYPDPRIVLGEIY